VGANVTFTANVALDLSGRSRVGLNNWAVSGPDAAEYDEYSFSPFRKLSTSIEWIVSLDTTQTYPNLNAWLAANTPDSSGSSLTRETTILNHTGVSVTGSGTGSLLRIRFAASSTDLDNFWDPGLAGDSITMNFSYS
jgi:hypothetical protein